MLEEATLPKERLVPSYYFFFSCVLVLCLDKINSFPSPFQKKRRRRKEKEGEEEEIKGFGVYQFTLSLLYSFSSDCVVRIIYNLKESVLGDSYNLNHLN